MPSQESRSAAKRLRMRLRQAQGGWERMRYQERSRQARQQRKYKKRQKNKTPTTTTYMEEREEQESRQARQKDYKLRERSMITTNMKDREQTTSTNHQPWEEEEGQGIKL